MRKILAPLLLSSVALLGYDTGNSCDSSCNNCCGCFSLTGLKVSGEYLLWYARENALPYALHVRTRPTFQQNQLAPDTPINYQILPKETIPLKASWDSGFRVGAALEGDCSNWDIAASYTRFRTSKNDSFRVPFSVLTIDTNDSPFFIPEDRSLMSPWVNPTVSALNPSITSPNTPQFFGKISSRWKLSLNQVDVELGRNFCFQECFSTRAFFGARGLWSEIDFQTKPTRFFNNGVSDIEETYRVKFRNDFCGAGLLLGLEPHWSITNCFGLYGEAGFSLLWGRYRDKRHEKFSQVVDEGEELTFNLGTNKDSFRAMLPILDLGAGIRWKSNFSGDCFTFGIDVGWEHHHYFDHVYRLQLTGLGGEIGTNGRLSTFSNYTETTSDLSLAGLIVRAQLVF